MVDTISNLFERMTKYTLNLTTQNYTKFDNVYPY